MTVAGAPPLYTLAHGSVPLVVSIPHAGTWIPPEIHTHLTETGRRVVDTDWHVDRLYSFLAELDVTVLTATHSRTVVDLNRGPDGAKLYPGQMETGLCPTESFAGEALYAGDPPDRADIAARLEQYWRPYHDALEASLAQAQARHGFVHLLDAHSIASEVPRLFAGRLPDLNIGSNDGASADPALVERVATAASDSNFSSVVNGRFKGGYITRHYGRPAARVHAVQLELAWSTYLDEAAPALWRPDLAAPLIQVLQRIVRELLRT